MSQACETDATEKEEGKRAAIEVWIGYVLLGGVVASAALIIVGLLWGWLKTGRLGADYTIARMNLFEFVVADFRQVLAGDLRPRLLVNLGIAALLLTPYLRVLVSLLFFSMVEHNWKYSVFTGLVLAVLTYSLFLR